MDPLALLAKRAVETFIKEGRIITPPDDLPQEFYQRKAGAFVMIKKNGKLRGCIGTYLPTRPTIVEEVIKTAILAATDDPRFEKIALEELPLLSYTVCILGYPKLVKEIKELDPKKYGVLVKTFPLAYPNEEFLFDGTVLSKTGVFLPELDDANTVQEQISLACQRAGIDPEKEKFFIYKFEIEKYQ